MWMEGVGKGRVGKVRVAVEVRVVGKGRVEVGRVEVVVRAPHSGCSTGHFGRSHLQMCGCTGVDVQPAGVGVLTRRAALNGEEPSKHECAFMPTQ
jgi:hypothetical protein